MDVNATVSAATGVVLLAVWGVTALGIGATSGWVHLPLAVGVVLIARAITLTGDSSDRSRPDA